MWESLWREQLLLLNLFDEDLFEIELVKFSDTMIDWDTFYSDDKFNQSLTLIYNNQV